MPRPSRKISLRINFINNMGPRKKGKKGIIIGTGVDAKNPGALETDELSNSRNAKISLGPITKPVLKGKKKLWKKKTFRAGGGQQKPVK